MEIKKDIGKRFKQCRYMLLGEDAEQKDFASYLSQKGESFSKQNISDWETGKSLIALNAQIILVGIGISLNWLLSGEGTKYADNEAGKALSARFSEAEPIKEHTSSLNGEEQIQRHTPDGFFYMTPNQKARLRLVKKWLVKDDVGELYKAIKRHYPAVRFNDVLYWVDEMQNDKKERPFPMYMFGGWLAEEGLSLDWFMEDDADYEPWIISPKGEERRCIILGIDPETVPVSERPRPRQHRHLTELQLEEADVQ